jgi:hypothetical protein
MTKIAKMKIIMDYFYFTSKNSSTEYVINQELINTPTFSSPRTLVHFEL